MLILRTLSLGLLILAAPLASHSEPQTEPIKSITIVSDHSLIVPLNLLAQDYARRHNVSITTNFNSTKTQIKDIEEGAEANILIAAKNSWIKTLQQKGLIDVYSRANIARNRLVLAGSQLTRIPPALNNDSNIRDLTQDPEDFTFSLGDPEYTAEGSYGLEALNSLDLLGMLEPHYHFFRNMYELINAVDNDNAMGFAFRTDALLFPKVKILQNLPPDTHPPILYEAVVIAGENMEEGREFITYLQGDYAKEVFASFGFDEVF